MKHYVRSSQLYRSLRNQRDSPLLRLPGELRNKIYRYTLSDHLWKLNVPESRHGKTFASLAQVCRQTHMEIGVLPFQLCVFRLQGRIEAK